MSAVSPPPPEIWDLFAISAAQIKTGGGGGEGGGYYTGPGSPESAGAHGGDLSARRGGAEVNQRFH